MKALLIRIWTDETFFVRLLRSAVLVLGDLVQRGVLPTGVSGGGKVIGPLLMGLSLMVPAGQLNAQPNGTAKK